MRKVTKITVPPIEDSLIVAEFEQLLTDMKPNLPRVTKLNIPRLKRSSYEEQTFALKWLRAIQRTIYADLVAIVNCMPRERWEYHTQMGHNQLEEMILRAERESLLRYAWDTTKPECLRPNPKPEKVQPDA
jgi:hypothetical protein